MHIEVYTDGSATTNDKPGGYGWVMVHDGVKYSEGSGHMEKASNNDAELEAAIQGLSAAVLYINTCSTIPGEGWQLTLVSDSQLILGWADGTYAFRQLDKIEKFKTLQLLVQNYHVNVRWVKGHDGDEHNERCDKLANAARTGEQMKVDKVEAILEGNTLIGRKKSGVICIWHKNVLKVISLEDNIIENYDRTVHGTRGSMLEVREDKLR